MWEYLKEGWLSKTGPRASDAFRKRWVTVDYTKLTYSEEALVSGLIIKSVSKVILMY